MAVRNQSRIGKAARLAAVGLALACAPTMPIWAQGTGGGGGTTGGTGGTTGGTGGATGGAGEAGGGTAGRTDTDDDGFDMGWLGLIGLAGLAGLMRRRDTHDTVRGASPRTA